MAGRIERRREKTHASLRAGHSSPWSRRAPGTDDDVREPRRRSRAPGVLSLILDLLRPHNPTSRPLASRVHLCPCLQSSL